MKKVLILGATIFLTSLIYIVQFSYLNGNLVYPETIVQTAIQSKILNEERKIIIHHPRNYDRKKEYPVMYVLDGNSQVKHIANKFDILSTAG